MQNYTDALLSLAMDARNTEKLQRERAAAELGTFAWRING